MEMHFGVFDIRQFGPGFLDVFKQLGIEVDTIHAICAGDAGLADAQILWLELWKDKELGERVDPTTEELDPYFWHFIATGEVMRPFQVHYIGDDRGRATQEFLNAVTWRGGVGVTRPSDERWLDTMTDLSKRFKDAFTTDHGEDEEEE